MLSNHYALMLVNFVVSNYLYLDRMELKLYNLPVLKTDITKIKINAAILDYHKHLRKKEPGYKLHFLNSAAEVLFGFKA